MLPSVKGLGAKFGEGTGEIDFQLSNPMTLKPNEVLS